MNATVIWYFVKFFQEESHADQFMAGGLHLNTLAYFKQVESEDNDGRMDATEAIAMWWQPADLEVTLNAPGFGDIKVTKADLAGPISMSFNYHNYLHLFCLYAVHTTGFKFIDNKIDCLLEEAEALQRQLDGHLEQSRRLSCAGGVRPPCAAFVPVRRQAEVAVRGLQVAFAWLLRRMGAWCGRLPRLAAYTGRSAIRSRQVNRLML